MAHLKRLLALLTCGALIGCAGSDSNSVIDRGRGGGNRGGEREKPSASLSSRVMLALAGLADLHEILSQALHPQGAYGCVKKLPSLLEWNCSDNKDRPAGRRGQIQFTQSPTSLSLTTEALNLTSWIKSNGQVFKSDQSLDLQVINGRLLFVSTYAYEILREGRKIRYALNWQVNAKIQGTAPNFRLSQGDALFTIQRANQGSREQAFQYQLSFLDKELELKTCGQTEGSFLFKGFDQEEIQVVASAKNVAADGAPERFGWASCIENLYSLKVAAPLWRQPDPK